MVYRRHRCRVIWASYWVQHTIQRSQHKKATSLHSLRLENCSVSTVTIPDINIITWWRCRCCDWYIISCITGFNYRVNLQTRNRSRCQVPRQDNPATTSWGGNRFQIIRNPGCSAAERWYLRSGWSCDMGQTYHRFCGPLISCPFGMISQVHSVCRYSMYLTFGWFCDDYQITNPLWWVILMPSISKRGTVTPAPAAGNCAFQPAKPFQFGSRCWLLCQ